MAYKLDFLDSALAEWVKLDKSIRDPLQKKLERRLESPQIENEALSGKLAGHYKIRHDKSGYRLIYFVDQDCVVVTAVGKRAGKAAYLAAISRLPDLLG